MRVCRLGLGAITLLTLTSRAGADECTFGDVKSIFNSIEVFVAQRERGHDTRKVGQVYGPIGGPCHYRFWAGPPQFAEDTTPPTQTFTSSQFFLGAVGWAWDYQNMGLSLAQAEDDIALIEDHVYLMEADDQWSYDPDELLQHEQPLLVTAFRQVYFGDVGLLVMRQKGIIDQLHAGHYVSLYKSSYPGNPDLEALHPGDEDWAALFAPLEESAVIYLDIVP